MIKLIAVDLDGTLLNEEKALSPETIRAIAAVKEKGVEVVLATGRTYAAVKPIYYGLNLNGPVVTNNGALIYHPLKDEILAGRSIDSSVLVPLLNWLDQRGVYNQYYTKDMIYTRRLGFLSKEWAKKNETLPEDRRIEIKVLGDGPLPEEINHQLFYKLLVMDTQKEVLETVASYIKTIPELETTVSIENGLDIMPAGITKGFGVSLLAEVLSIKPEEVMAFGDQENDIEMLTYAGVGVAMDNASDFVKSHANCVAGHHNLNGLALFIKDYFKL